MTPAVWEVVKSAFAEAIEAPLEERDQIIERYCEGSTEALHETRRLLAHADNVASDGEEPLASLHALRRIGSFDILNVIGSGGSGVVHRAIDVRTGDVVAVKVLRLSIASERAARRLEFEGELLRRLRHDNIAQVLDVGVVDSTFGHLPFIAMEYIDGVPIDAFVARHDLSDEDCVGLMSEVCETVGYAHQLGIIHRDLKPANILMTTDGRPKVLDFGIARDTLRELAATADRTQLGDVLGTPGYMSPEQCSGGLTPLSTSADVYALGVILYELLTRQRLFNVDDLPLHEAMRAIAAADPPLIRQSRPQLRGDLEAVLAQALQRNPRQRYDTALTFADDLRRLRDRQPVRATPVTGRYMVRRFARQHRAVLAAALIVIVCLAIALGWQRRVLVRDAARVQAYSLAFRIHDAETADEARQTNEALLVALSSAEFSAYERHQLHDRVRAALVQRASTDRLWLQMAADHQQSAWELAIAQMGREDEQSLRALQIYTELLAMTERANAAEALIRTEFDHWGFDPDAPPDRASAAQLNRLLRLASTYGETLSRLDRHDDAVDYLQRVLAAQMLFFEGQAGHTDPDDTRALLAVAEKRRDEATSAP